MKGWCQLSQMLNKKVAQMLLERVGKFCAKNDFFFWACTQRSGCCGGVNLRLNPIASEQARIGDQLLDELTFDFQNQKVTGKFNGELLEAPLRV